MTVSSIKALLWLVTLGVVGYLGFTIYDWRQNQGNLLAPTVTEPLQREYLENVEKPEPPKQQIHSYKDSIEPNFFELNWTGKLPPPPPPPPVERKNPNARVPATPIADLLVVQFVQVDTSRPELSKALIKYTDQALSKLYDGEPQWLYAGDALGGVHKLWTVGEIRPNEVLFVRLLADGEPDEEEDDQIARPPTAFDGDTLIVDATDGGAVVPSSDGEYFPPLGDDLYVGRERERTQEVRPNYFQVGTVDRQQFNENYLDILSTEVRTRPYKENGRAAGIQIQSVVPGSLAAQHGAKSGDVIKSINGSPVNSTQEAISYVKNNQGKYSSWEVVVWNSGKERTVTYNVP